MSHDARPVLVTGATGRLGRLLVPRLLARGVPVRVLTRDPVRAQAVLGPAVEAVPGSPAQPDSLPAAVAGASAVFLLSPITPTLDEEQIAVADAAAAAGVARIVKLSGSEWTLTPPGRSLSGDLHARVERHLARLGVPHLALRPNAWMQVALGRLAEQVRSGIWTHAFGQAATSTIDARDIADVAVHALLDADADGSAWVLTGGQALTQAAIAALASRISGRPLEIREATAGTAAGAAGDFLQTVHQQFFALIRAGEAAEVTPTVRDLLGRAPRTVEAFVREQCQAAAATD